MDTLVGESHDQNIDYKVLLSFFLEAKLKYLVLNEKYNILHSVIYKHSLKCFLL